MKTKTLLIIISVILLISSCRNKGNNPKNFLLPDKVKATYIVDINNEPKTEWINSVKQSNFLLSLVNNAIDGKTVFDYEDCKDTLCKDDILSNLGQINANISYVDSLGNEIDTFINKKADFNSLEGFYFIENWFFDAQNLHFDKQIITYAPYRSYFKTNKDTIKTKKIIFFIKQNDKTQDEFEKIAENVKSAFIYNATEPNSISGLDIDKFNNFIVKYALNPENKVYNFNNLNEPLAIDDFKEHLGIETEYIISEDGTDTLKYVSDADADRITGVIFIEDWFFNKNTLELKKQVKAIAPVCEYYTSFGNSEAIKRIVIPFALKTN